jgi:hypothetical protein
MTALTILTTTPPDPADGAVTHGAELTIDGYDGRVRFFEATTLRDLAAVATALADRLDASAAS